MNAAATLSRHARVGVLSKTTSTLSRSCVLLGLVVVLTPALSATAGTTAKTEFDHLKTGFELLGAHIALPCERCHAGGVFEGTPRQCEGCHRSGSRLATTAKSRDHVRTTASCDECHDQETWLDVRFVHTADMSGRCVICHDGRTATGKSSGHIASGNRCDDCHSTTSWAATRFDHDGVTGACSSCHNGGKATGKSAKHIRTTQACEDCHRTTAWTPVVRVDHAAVIGTCQSCHDGRTATGKGSGHISSSNLCDNCHTTSNWTSVRFDHGEVTGSCSSCHDGRTATGKPANHVRTSGQCDVCHSTLAWTPASFDHDTVSGSCSSCHDGRTATGKGSGHFVTSLQCNECHGTRSWTPIDFRHSSAEYPGDHRSKVGCRDCHRGNTQTATWTNSAYKPDCAGCHASRYKAGEHKKVDSPKILYTVSELRDCSGSCHVYTDSSMRTIKKRKSGHHRVSNGGF